MCELDSLLDSAAKIVSILILAVLVYFVFFI